MLIISSDMDLISVLKMSPLQHLYNLEVPPQCESFWTKDEGVSNLLFLWGTWCPWAWDFTLTPSSYTKSWSLDLREVGTVILLSLHISSFHQETFFFFFPKMGVDKRRYRTSQNNECEISTSHVPKGVTR